MILKAHARHELAEASAIVKRGRRLFELDVNRREPRPVQSFDRHRHVGKLPRSPPAGERGREGRRRGKRVGAIEQTAKVGAASALRDQPAARRKSAVDARKQLIVVENPVKGRRAKDRVENIDKGQRGSVGADDSTNARSRGR